MDRRRPLYPNVESLPSRISYQSRQNSEKLQEKNWSQEKEKAYGQDLARNGGKTTRTQTSNGFMKQLSQQSVEMEEDEVMAKLCKLTAERDNLREQLKRSQAFQESALSERLFLVKQVEDLQGTVVRLDQERSDYASKQSAVEEQMLSLEGQVNALDRTLSATEEDLKKAKAECSSLRQLKNKAENSSSDRQRNLMAIIRELQQVEGKKKQLEERNESLSKQVGCLTEDARSLHSAVFQHKQERDIQRKQLDDKEKAIVNLKLRVEQQVTATDSLKQVLRGRDQELDAMRRNLTEAVGNLDTAMREKEDMFRTNSELGDNMDKAYLDQKALQRVVEGSSQEIEVLQKRLQEYINESSNKNKIMASKDKMIERLQLMVEDLGETTEGLQRGMDRGEEEMDAVQRKLMNTEETLDKVLKERKSMQEANTQLRDNLNKAQLDIQALQSMIEQSNQELEVLRGKLQNYIMNMSCLEEQLSYKDNVIDRMQMAVEEQDEMTKSLQQAINRGQLDLADGERNRSDLEGKLVVVMNEKEAMVLGNLEVRGNLDRASSDAQVLQLRIVECNQEAQDLQGKLQECEIEISCLEEQLCYKDKFIGHLELTIRDLQTSADNQQQVMNRGDQELEYVRRKFSKMEENLATVISEKEATLEETCDLKDDLEKAKMENQALQIKLEGSNHEREMFQRKLRDLFTECSNTKKVLSYKEKVIGRLQMTVEELETSTKALQQAARVRDQELEAVQRRLAGTEEHMAIMMKQKEEMSPVNSFFTGRKGQVNSQDKAPGQAQASAEAQEMSVNGGWRAMLGWNREVKSMRRNSRDALGSLEEEENSAVAQLLERRSMQR